MGRKKTTSTWTGAGAGAGMAVSLTRSESSCSSSPRWGLVSLVDLAEVKAEMSTSLPPGLADMKKRTQTVAMAAPSMKETSGLMLLISPPFIFTPPSIPPLVLGRGEGREGGFY